MAVELVISGDAENDLGDAYHWYEQRRVGLGEEFLGCIDACIQRICRTPDLFGAVHQDFRRALVRRFPYAVFYEYDGRSVTIYAVFHTSRDPKKWRERLS